VTPGESYNVCLPPRLLGRRQGPAAALAECHGRGATWVGGRSLPAMSFGHVTDPGDAGLAPRAARTK
jgi:hypothetical protein